MIYMSLRQTQRDELISLSHQAIGRVGLRAPPPRTGYGDKREADAS
jgi:hypothetical protein